MTTDQLLAEPETALPTLRGAVTGLPSYVPGRRSAGADIAALASNESHYEPLPAATAAVAEAAGRMTRHAVRTEPSSRSPSRRPQGALK